MAEGADSVEVTGADVETAIAEGLAILDVERDEVDVEVLEEPSRGVFGLGARDARVRLTLKPEAVSAVTAKEAVGVSEVEAPAEQPPELSEEAEEAEIARGTVLELLDLMEIRDARVEVARAEAAEGEDNPPLVLNISAPHDDLVGPEGDTLYALQRIVRLIVGREQESRVHLIVDVNGYKARRRQSLRRLAQRLAKQAVETDRRVVLEPMPPDERRIIHLALRDNPGVRTESIGEGDQRKVTIIPQ